MEDDLETFLNGLVLDATKAVLRSPFLDLMHDPERNPAELYLCLYAHFQKMALAQRREDAVAITPAAAKAMLEKVLAPALAIGSGAAGIGGKKRAAAAAGGDDPYATKDAPLVQQRALREQLDAQRVNLAGFSDIVEASRVLDAAQHAPGVFGAVNLLHVVALYLTLLPVRSLFELIRFVMEQDAAVVSDALRIKIFYLWSVIDAANRDALRRLCALLLDHSRLTVPLLLELFPAVEHIGTPRYAAAPGGAAAAAAGPRVAVHSEDAETSAAAPPPPAAAAGADNSDDDLDEAELEVQRTDEDRAFWANFAKGADEDVA